VQYLQASGRMSAKRVEELLDACLENLFR
jgi:hypothetical protein